METPAKQPKTLLEAIRYFADLDAATEFVASLRWPDGPVCPKCGLVDPKHYFLKTRRMWKCRSCKKQFSVKVGTIFEDSPLGLDKWLPAVWLIANCKNGISSYELAKDLGVQQKTAWFMLHRIRLAMQTGTFEKLSGQVEADETFIGGKARNMHKDKRAKKITGRGSSGKVAVMGLLERHGKVKTKIVPDTSSRTLLVEVRENVEPGSEVHTDALRSYRGLDAEYVHNVVDHAERYVDGHVHTNGLENFWSLLKRGIKGTYVSVEPYHLFRYLDEQAFRFNERTGRDAERFSKVAGSVAGRRLTYEQLTGVRMTEGRRRRTTPPAADWLLGSLVALANGVEDQGARVGVPVTLNVGGFLVSGLMIGGKEYFEIFSQIMEAGLPEALFGEEGKADLASMYRDFGSLYGPEEDENEPRSPAERYNFVHLRDARFLHTSGDPIPTNQGMLWRTRLRAVDGFTLGTIITEADSDEPDDDESVPELDG